MARRSRPNPASFLSTLAAEWARVLPVHRGYLGAGSLAGALTALLILGAGASAGGSTGAGAAAPEEFPIGVSALPPPWPAVLTLLTLSAFAAFGAATVLLSITDIRERRLPNVVVLSGTVALTVPLSIDMAAGGDVARLGFVWLAAAVFGLFMLALWFGLPGHIGAGDVKIAPAAIFLPGWSMTAIAPSDTANVAGGIEMAAFIFAFCLCAALVVAGFMVLMRRSRSRSRGYRRRDLAFGPVLLAASWGTVLVGVVLVSPTLTATIRVIQVLFATGN